MWLKLEVVKAVKLMVVASHPMDHSLINICAEPTIDHVITEQYHLSPYKIYVITKYNWIL